MMLPNKKNLQHSAAINEAEQLRKSLVLEISLMKPNEKTQFRALLDGYDVHLFRLKEQLKQQRNWIEKSLLTGGKNDSWRSLTKVSHQPADVRDKMLQETTVLQSKVGTSLHRSLKTAADTVHIGKSVTEELEAQREQINRIDDTVADVNHEIKQANKILGALMRRILADKLIICFSLILAGLVIAVIVLVSTGAIKTG